MEQVAGGRSFGSGGHERIWRAHSLSKVADASARSLSQLRRLVMVSAREPSGAVIRRLAKNKLLAASPSDGVASMRGPAEYPYGAYPLPSVSKASLKLYQWNRDAGYWKNVSRQIKA